VFGAPVALEDHALRGCLAALGIQNEAKCLATETTRHDGVDLSLRVGLNSGQVIAGLIGSAALAYTAIGAEVGIARRMESVALPRAVMLSASTARLVEGTVALGESERVRIKGLDEPVAARRLLAVAPQRQRTGLGESTMVGREVELAALTAMLDRAIAGRGSVVGVAGPAGIGKTRFAGEVVQLARSLGVEVFSTFCESHSADVPFGVIARLLRTVGQVNGLDDQTARARMRALINGVDREDMLLLDDLLGILDAGAALPKIDPDARRRRLTALIKAVQLTHSQPTVIVVEDAHWIDAVSESMLADFLAVAPRTHWLVLITYRPEYRGPLQHVAGGQHIALAPLSESESTALVGELLGPDPSVVEVAEIVAQRAAGNPFFAQEIIRELAERGVLEGQRGCHRCVREPAEVRVPPTLQATIAARIDRLGPAAKRTLSAAAVIGSPFDWDLLTSLEIDACVGELVAAELIDQVQPSPSVEYIFRHPLIRTVAYESQLKADRAGLHGQLAAAIEAREPESADSNAALIAEHLTAAGDLRAAYCWHMRFATWATNRDITTARQSWERAQKIADELPADTPQRAAMRIAPRTMLCGVAIRCPINVAGPRFEELRELCIISGDKASLAIAMAGLVIDHVFQNRVRQASQVASETMALAESLGEPTLMVGLSVPVVYALVENTEWCEVLRWSQRVIELADGDPSKGNFIFGSPLAIAFATRAVARWCLGHPGWKIDLRHGITMARATDPASYALVVSYGYLAGVPNGVLSPDDSAIRAIENAQSITERSGDDFALNAARVTLGVALLHRDSAADRDRGHKLLSEMVVRDRHGVGDSPIVEVYLAREQARRGNHDEAIPLIRAATDYLFREGRLLGWCIAATGVLVETLLDRGDESDVALAEAAFERLATAPSSDGLRVRDIWLLRLQALIARARGDQASYRELFDRYQVMAESLNYEGHITWSTAMV
jgi:hypothetical protein